VVVVFMVRFIVVIVSNPGEIIVSCKENGAPSVTICHLGTFSKVGLVKEKLTLLIV